MMEQEFEQLRENLSALKSLHHAKDEQQVARRCAELLRKVDKCHKPAPSKKLFYFLAISMLLAGIVVLKWDSWRIHFIYFLRIVFVLANKVYDLSEFTLNHCLVSNPFHVSNQPFEMSACKKGCSADKRIPLPFETKLSDTDDVYAIKSEFYYKNVYESNTPVIFGRETADWPVNQMTIEQIVDMFADAYERQIIQDSSLCLFDSGDNINDFLEGKLSSGFTVSWENCDKESSRLIRKITRRPIFLSKSTELVSTSWVYLSKGSRKPPLYQNHYFQLPLTLKITMLCQISGSLDVNIVPNKECASHCTAKKKITLKPGDILTLSNMWRVKFRKADDQDTITVALFGH